MEYQTSTLACEASTGLVHNVLVKNDSRGETSNPVKQSRWTKTTIRILDIAVVISLACIIAPLLVLIMLLIKAHDGGSPFYGQTRIGLNGKTFKCWKFRSMVLDSQERLKELLETDKEAAEEWARDQKLRNDPRITKVGLFLRKTSLDELPQLWNIFKGEMSLVGPRPIIENEVPRYGEFFDFYKSVKPGVTGLWQVSGRNDTSYDERVQLDVDYVKNKSISADFGILIKTIPAILFSKGAY